MSPEHPLRLSHPSRGFSLIELLVVVSIIALLIAMLLPALAKVKEVSRRAVCAANLHSFGIAAAAYAHDSLASTPIGQPAWPTPGVGIEVCYYIAPSATFPFPTNRVWYGAGLLFAGNYVTDGRVYLCPSNPYEPWSYRSQSAWFTQPGQIDGYLQITYQYRCTDNGWRPMNLALHSPKKALLADLWVSGWFDMLHKDGANTLYLDGSVAFVGGPLKTYVAGAWPATNTDWAWQEAGWRSSVDR